MTPIGRRGAYAVLAVLGGLVAIDVPQLGSDPWPFHAAVHPRGLFAPLVRAAGRHWDLGFVRTPGIIAALLVALVAAAGWRWAVWRPKLLAALALIVVLALLVPAVVLQTGLRQSTHPWEHVNDSTYQIEVAGELIRRGENPYGAGYAQLDFAKWYPAAGFTGSAPQVALEHFAYFPGTPLTAAAWGVLPRPLDDYRFFVLLATVGLFFAAFAFRGPAALKISLGAALAANPLAVHAVWFGTADAPSLLCVVLAFALLSRRRLVWASLALGLAVLLKQFALVALPFFVLMLLLQRPARREARWAVAAFAGPLLAGFLPFLIASPGRLWDDTVAYGGSTYRIIGYGLSSLFLKAGWVDDRFGAYPFVWLLVLVWLPVTAWLLWSQWRARALWFGAVGFTVSMFVLLFISRVFQTSYLVWPLVGTLCAVLLANPDDEDPGTGADVPREIDRGEPEAVRAGP